MNTPAHLLIGAGAFADPVKRGTAAAAMLGAVFPDLSLYLMVGWSLWVMDIPPGIVFDQLYFSDAWMAVFAIDNSFILWGIGLGIGLLRRRPVIIAFCGAALLHIACDFPLHHDDPRPHFWPLSDWRFESPFSYWDRRHGAGWIAPLEGVIATVMFVLLWRRFHNWALRGGFLLLWALQLFTVFPASFWMMMQVFATNS